MMFDNLMFFIYIFAAFIGFAAVALIWLVVKYKKKQWSGTMKAMLGFVVSSLVIGMIYFINMYLATVTGNYQTGLPVRVLDIAGFVSLELFWIKFMRAVLRQKCPDWNKSDRAWDVSILALMVWSAVSYGIFTDDVYYVSGTGAQIYMTVLELVLCITMTLFIGINAAAVVKRIKDKGIRAYILIAGGLITANGVWNGITTVWLFRGSVMMASWQDQVTDPTPLLIMALNIVTLIYIEKNDFGPLYLDGGRDDEEALAEMSEEFGLTARESEIVVLLYEGLSNDEIAGKLFISKNTVKHHVYNLYRKLGVSTRMALAALVKNRK